MAGLISTTYEEPKKKTTQNAAVPAANNIAAQAAPNAIQMNYTDPSGNNAVGYSINNRMYKDAAGTQRIDEGSIVANQAGTQSWIMQNGAGVPIANYQPGANAAITNAYGSAVRAANQRMEADIAQIEANRPKINDAYNQLQQQNYQGYMQSQKALANQLASQGLYNSGYSDTAKVAQNVGYRSAQSETERARLQELADLETEINVARLNGSANLAELEAEYAILQNEQANYEREFAYNAAQDLMDRNRQREQDALDNAYAAANFGDYSQLEALGVDTTEARAAVARGVRQEDVDYATQLAALGDYSGLEALGIDPTTYREANERAAFSEQFAIAAELAQMGDFSKLVELGIDPAYYEQIMNNELALSNNSVKQSNLAIEAAYQDLALGNQEIEANKKALAEQETEAAKEVSAETQLKAEAEADALAKMYLNSGKTRNELLAYLSTDTAKNYYVKQFGQSGYDYLLALASAAYDDYAAPEEFDTKGFVDTWKDNIFSTVEVDDGDGRKTKERVADSKQQRAAWEELQYALAYGQITETEFYQILSSLGISRTTSDMWYNPTKPINN